MIHAVIPAHNEAENLPATVAALRAEGVESILIGCDNCTDESYEVALSLGVGAFETVNNTAMKAGVLNAALSRIEWKPGDMALCLDADTILQPGWVDEALRVLNGQPGVGAVGAIFEADRDTGWLRRAQALEWHRFARQSARTGKTFVLSGTAALIRTEALREVHETHGTWYSPVAITEDFDFTVRLLGVGWSVASPDACRVTTDTMPTWADLFRQRRRWSLGAIQTVTRHGLHRHTAIYWGQQAMLMVSILAMTLLLAVTGAAVVTGTFVVSPLWCGVGAVFAIERVVTVRDRPWPDRLFAATVLPELGYALVLQAAHLAAVGQYLTGSTGSWAHARTVTS